MEICKAQLEQLDELSVLFDHQHSAGCERVMKVHSKAQHVSREIG